MTDRRTRNGYTHTRGTADGRAPLCVVLMLALLQTAPLQAQTLTIDTPQNLRFGTMVVGATGGNVVVAPDGHRSCDSGITCVPGEPGSAALFRITNGTPLETYTIQLPGSGSLNDGGNASMNLVDFTDSGNGAITLDSQGEGDFTVGATLQIDPGQQDGDYSGAFEVQVNLEQE